MPVRQPYQPKQRNKGMSISKIFWSAVLGICGIVALTVIFGSYYTVDQTERGVLTRNGAFVEVVQPGFNWKLPWVDAVTKADMRDKKLVYGGDTDHVFEAYSRDQQPAKLRISITYQPDPTKVQDLYQRYALDMTSAAQQQISPKVFEQVKTVFGQYDAASAINKRGALNVDTQAALNKSLKDENSDFTVTSIQIEDVSFSPAYVLSIEERMKAEVDVQKKTQLLEQEKIDAQIALTRAQGIANSTLAQATADAQSTVLRGDAEAKAIKAKSDALQANPSLVEYTKAVKWNGALPITMVPGGTVPFMNVGSPTK